MDKKQNKTRNIMSGYVWLVEPKPSKEREGWIILSSG
jgi:hypothetical protein